MVTTTAGYGVLDPAIAIESMRSNGYISTDTALLELIDNSIDADARTVNVFCFEGNTTLASGRSVERVERIGVLDDGKGMTPAILRQSLRFGGREEENRSKIGRFGFGLPNASISQCNLTQVWSWKSGHTNAVRAYLNVEEVSSGSYQEVPKPELDPLPEYLLNLVDEPSQSGSYVEWSELGSQGTWKRGVSVVHHTSKLVGRVYRKFLSAPGRAADEAPLQIVLHVVSPDGEVVDSLPVIPNDPLFLMAPTSARWDDEPMFQPYLEQQFDVPDSKGTDRTVTVTLSYSTPEARATKNGVVAGSQDHGQDALRNQGISIVRNGRELELADVVNVDRYLDRWWGCEIDFPAELDELFGVSNNKQGASSLTYYLKQLSKDDRSLFNFEENDEIDRGEPLGELIYMTQWIDETLRALVEPIRRQQRGTRGKGEKGKRHDDDSAEARASKQSERRAKDHPTPEEQDEQDNPTPKEDQRKAGIKSLVEQGYEEDEAEKIMSVALTHNRRVLFLESTPASTSEAVFDVTVLKGARVEVVLNKGHRAYEGLVEILTGEEVEEASVDDLVERIGRAADNLKMLFAAWARLEAEAKAGEERRNVAKIRNAWGRMADDFLRED